MGCLRTWASVREVMESLDRRKELVIPRFNRLHLAAQWRTDYGVKEGDREPRRRQLL